MMQADKLVIMLNQIAAFYRRRPADEAAGEIALHVEHYWEPRMRTAAYAYLDNPTPDLDPNAVTALTALRLRDGTRIPFEPAATSHRS